MIKMTHAEQPLHVQLGSGWRELLDGGYILRQQADPLGVYHVTEEGHSGLGEDTLVQVHHQVVLTKSGEDLPEMLLVVIDGGAAFQAIIFITEDKCQLLFFFHTKCRGLAHEELEQQMTPAASISAKATLAMANFSSNDGLTLE